MLDIEPLSEDFLSDCFVPFGNFSEFLVIIKAFTAIGCKFTGTRVFRSKEGENLIHKKEWDIDYRGDESTKLVFVIQISSGNYQKNGVWSLAPTSADGLSDFWSGVNLSFFL